MINSLVLLIKRSKKALVNLLSSRRRKKQFDPLAVYAKVAEEIAAIEGGGNAISKKSQRILRVLQKNLLGNYAINLEE